MASNYAFKFLLLLVICFVFTGNVATAATYKKETATTALAEEDVVTQATVNIFCRLRNGLRTYISSGSGVFIDSQGVILTNAHVAQYFLLANKEKGIKGRCAIRTGSPAKDTYLASVLYIPTVWIENSAISIAKEKPRGTGEDDFALLYVTDSKRKGALPVQFPALPLDLTGVTVNEEVTIAGYPSEDLQFKEVINKLKRITAASTITNVDGYSPLLPDLITLAPSDASQHGVSGGPVVDKYNQVIGIATSKSTSKDNRTLRAITLPYINRVVQIQTGSPLNILMAGDLSVRAAVSQAAITPEMIDIVKRNLLRKKK